jgi:hypothetical protein
MIGDTVCGEQQFQDEEINAAINSRGSLVGACADLCRALATKYSRSVDMAIVGGGRATYSQLSKQYLRQAISFEAKAATLATGYVGGVSIADKLNNEMNIDRPDPQFSIGMHDNWLPVAPIGADIAKESID